MPKFVPFTDNISHDYLCEIMINLNHIISTKGCCAGLANESMEQTIRIGNLDSLHKTLHFPRQNYFKKFDLNHQRLRKDINRVRNRDPFADNAIGLTSEEKNIIALSELFVKIEKYQHANINLEKVLAIANSNNNDKNNENIVVADSFSAPYSLMYLEIIYKSLQAILEEKKIKFSFSLILNSAFHEINISYFYNKDPHWCITDANKLNFLTDVFTADELVKEILSGFSSNEIAVIATRIYVAESNVDELKKYLEIWKSEEKWKEIHEIKNKINLVDSDDINCLALAVRSDELGKIKELIDCGFNPNLLYKLPFFGSETAEFESTTWESPFICAIKDNKLDIIKIMMKSETIDFNLRMIIYQYNETKYSYTLLGFAIKHGNLQIIQLLLNDSRVDPSQGYCINDEYFNSLQMAIGEESIETVKLLLKKISLTEKEKENLVHFAEIESYNISFINSFKQLLNCSEKSENNDVPNSLPITGNVTLANDEVNLDASSTESLGESQERDDDEFNIVLHSDYDDDDDGEFYIVLHSEDDESDNEHYSSKDKQTLSSIPIPIFPFSNFELGSMLMCGALIVSAIGLCLSGNVFLGVPAFIAALIVCGGTGKTMSNSTQKEFGGGLFDAKTEQQLGKSSEEGKTINPN